MAKNTSNFSGIDLHESTKRLLLLCQVFGLIPVFGIINGKLIFKHNIKVYYSCLVLMAHLVMSIMAIIDLVLKDINFRSCNVIMIYVPGFLMHWQFFKLAETWPDLMRNWQMVDDNFKGQCYKMHIKKHGGVSRMVHLTAVMILLITICEYSFSVGSVYDVIRKTNKHNPLQEMTETLFSFITDHVRYSPVLSFLLLVINFFCTFIWNFMDLFIIIMSNALVNKFEIISSKIIKSTREELASKRHWQKMREDYNKITNLFHYIDDQLCAIVMLSFACNVYFILIQLFQSLSLSYSDVENIYFFVSFGMLLLRTSAVSILAARVNEASRAPLTYLTLQPTEFCCTEFERLVFQISQNDVALSGNKCFRITRGFLFRLAGIIVTYELFLFQFSFSYKRPAYNL